MMRIIQSLLRVNPEWKAALEARSLRKKNNVDDDKMGIVIAVVLVGISIVVGGLLISETIHYFDWNKVGEIVIGVLWALLLISVAISVVFVSIKFIKLGIKLYKKLDRWADKE